MAPNAQEVMESPDAILATLSSFHHARSPISITLAKGKGSFNTYMLEIKDQEIHLDQLIPKNGDQLLIPGSTIELTIYHQGVNYRCQSQHIHLSTDESGYPFHQITIPTKIFYTEQRSSFRLKLKLSTTAPIQLITTDGNRLQANLDDLSNTGARIRVKHGPQNISVNDKVECEINLKDIEPLTLKAVIRQCQKHPQTGETLAGIEFLKLPAKMAKQLHKALMKLQRQSIRSDLTL